MDKTKIDYIKFGIMSEKEITQLSVLKICSTKLNGPNSLYDERLGTMDNNKNCITCGLNNKLCPGHFGHIELNVDIIHPLFYKTAVSFLRIFCIKCSRLFIKKDQIILNNFHKLPKESRFNKISEKIEKIELCPHCGNYQPKITFSTTENNIYMNYKNSKENIKTHLTEVEIKNIFENISNEDISILGLDPSAIHPRNIILSVLPVLPPVARPYVVADNITCDDDLTIQYLEIVKINNNLGKNDLPESKRQKYLQSIKFRIKCIFDNSHEKAKHTNGRPMKGIKKRLSGKEGQIRNNLMGKRVNKSARTVIGPDSTLKLGEIAIPSYIATTLTYPVKVNKYNIDKLSTLVNSNHANFVVRKNGARINLKYAMFTKQTPLLYGDKILSTHTDDKGNVCEKEITIDSYSKYVLKEGDKVIRDGNTLEKLKLFTQKNINIEIGDTVERHLQDGDIVLLNRQPTLHKGSMLSKRILIKPGKTIRMNLATTKSFNADFDGDEMNIHVPASPQTEAELRNLSATKYNMISSQSSKNVITIVQDALLGNYKMTLPEQQPLTREKFFQIAIKGHGFISDFILKKIEKIKNVLTKMNKDPYPFTGKGLFSLTLPDNFIYSLKNNSHPIEHTVHIYDGVLYEGVINKKNLGSSHTSITRLLYKEYNENVAEQFVNNVQFLAYEWLLYHGFSVGISDCIATKTEQINEVITRCFIEAKGVEETTNNKRIREIKINAALSKARDNGMKLAKDALDQNNNFVSTVTSGSKGDYFNIAQITGLLGQQNFQGKRIMPTLNNYTRTLPHYPVGDITKEMDFESKGFIKNSFIHGLNPREFWFHAITGREGVTDTAMKTAQSGYIQRRMVKLGEDVQVKNDGTVRDASNNIIQFQYGNNNLDPTKTVMVNGKQQFCNISRMVDRLNLQHEKNITVK